MLSCALQGMKIYFFDGDGSKSRISWIFEEVSLFSLILRVYGWALLKEIIEFAFMISQTTQACRNIYNQEASNHCKYPNQITKSVQNNKCSIQIPY